jgi:hypothetical protein
MLEICQIGDTVVQVAWWVVALIIGPATLVLLATLIAD